MMKVAENLKMEIKRISNLKKNLLKSKVKKMRPVKKIKQIRTIRKIKNKHHHPKS